MRLNDEEAETARAVRRAARREGELGPRRAPGAHPVRVQAVNTRPARGPADTNAVAHVFVDALDDRCDIDGRRRPPSPARAPARRRASRSPPPTGRARGGATRSSRSGPDASRSTRAVRSRSARSRLISVALAGRADEGRSRRRRRRGHRARRRPASPRCAPSAVVVRWDRARAEKAVGRLRTVAREAAMQSRRRPRPRGRRSGRASRTCPTRRTRCRRPRGFGPVGASDPGFGLDGARRGRKAGSRRRSSRCSAGAPKVALGAYVLRAATAPIAAVAVLTAEAACDRGVEVALRREWPM